MERSEKIGACERFLRELEFTRFRIRDHGDLVRIEVGPDEIHRFSLPATREAIVVGFKEIGFSFVGLDLVPGPWVMRAGKTTCPP